MNLEDAMPSEISRTQKGKDSMVSFMCGIQRSQTHRNREQDSGYQWRGGGVNGEMLVKDYNIAVI